MLKPGILVTGATGKTGSIVAAELLKAGYRARALVHREDGRSRRLTAQGAVPAIADMSDVECVADALQDVQRVYYCPPFDPYMIQGAVAFTVAAKEAGGASMPALTGSKAASLELLSLLPLPRWVGVRRARKEQLLQSHRYYGYLVRLRPEQ